VRAVQLPDNSFNAESYFLTVFGRPESSSACECERSADASLAQSLHLFNSADVQTKLTADDGLAATRAVQLPDNSFNAASYFLTVFGRPESNSACECERSADASLAQSLHLFNSADLQTKLTADSGRAAALVKEAAKKDEDKVRELYLWAFARQPDAEEQKLAAEHLARERKDKDGKPDAPEPAKRQAYEDLLWALINTKEFLFNH
jgi:hypothetical protein